MRLAAIIAQGGMGLEVEVLPLGMMNPPSVSLWRCASDRRRIDVAPRLFRVQRDRPRHAVGNHAMRGRQRVPVEQAQGAGRVPVGGHRDAGMRRPWLRPGPPSAQSMVSRMPRSQLQTK